MKVHIICFPISYCGTEESIKQFCKNTKLSYSIREDIASFAYEISEKEFQIMHMFGMVIYGETLCFLKTPYHTKYDGNFSFEENIKRKIAVMKELF